MPKILTLALSLLIAVAWLQAQNQYPRTGSTQTGTEATGQTAVEGCLQSANGNFSPEKPSLLECRYLGRRGGVVDNSHRFRQTGLVISKSSTSWRRTRFKQRQDD